MCSLKRFALRRHVNLDRTMKKGSSVLVLVAALVVASVAEAQRRTPDLRRLEQGLEAVYDRLADGASPQEVRDDIDELHSSFSERTERLRARLDRTDRAVRELGLGGAAAERLARARAAFIASYEAVLESLDRLREEPDLAEAVCILTKPGTSPVAVDTIGGNDNIPC